MQNFVANADRFRGEFLNALEGTTMEILNQHNVPNIPNNGLRAIFSRIAHIVIDQLVLHQIPVNAAISAQWLNQTLDRLQQQVNIIFNNIGIPRVNVIDHARILSRHFSDLGTQILHNMLMDLKDDFMADVFTPPMDSVTSELLVNNIQFVHEYQSEPVLRQLRAMHWDPNYQQGPIQGPMQQVNQIIDQRARDADQFYLAVATMYRTNGVANLVDSLLQKKQRNLRRHLGNDVQQNVLLNQPDHLQTFAAYIDQSIFRNIAFTGQEMRNSEWSFRQYRHELSLNFMQKYRPRDHVWWLDPRDLQYYSSFYLKYGLNGDHHIRVYTNNNYNTSRQVADTDDLEKEIF